MLTSAFRVCRFLLERTLADRVHFPFGLHKLILFLLACVQVSCGAGFMQAGRRVLVLLHLFLLRDFLVVRECTPTAATLLVESSMLGTKSNTLRHALQADLKLRAMDDKCWLLFYKFSYFTFVNFSAGREFRHCCCAFLSLDLVVRWLYGL